MCLLVDSVYLTEKKICKLEDRSLNIRQTENKAKKKQNKTKTESKRVKGKQK